MFYMALKHVAKKNKHSDACIYLPPYKLDVLDNILTRCSKCNTFQVIIDLVHNFMNFNALKIILKIH